MVVESYYINQLNIDYVTEVTGLAPDEVEAVVGRFAKHSRRSGQLRGKLCVKIDGSVEIRHHFNNKLLWRQ